MFYILYYYYIIKFENMLKETRENRKNYALSNKNK